jgi:hypothetical protein
MKSTGIVVCLLVAANALAVRMDIDPHRKLEPAGSERLTKVLLDARGTFALEDGSQWIRHRVPAAAEPSAIGVTRFGPDGSARVYLVSDWLPKGTIPRGRCGQVFGVALLTDGRVAVSAGWNDGNDSYNAVLVLHALDDGRYATDKVIELPGVAQIAGGPRNTFVAVTSTVSIPGGGPMLTIFDTDGKILGRFFDGDPFLNIIQAVQNASAARLQRLGESRFALYDHATEIIRVFDVDFAGSRANVKTRASIFIDDAAGADVRVVGMQPSSDGDLLVARTGVIRGRPGTQLTIYDENGGVKQSSVLEHPWNFMLQEHGRVRGVVMRDGISLDTVIIRADQ